MRRAEAVVAALAAPVGSALGTSGWVVAGGLDGSLVAVWLWSWLGSVVAVPLALLVAGASGVMATGLAFLILSAIPFGVALTDARAASFGPSVGDWSHLVTLLGVPVAAVLARFVGTRQGRLPASTSATIGIAAAGALVGGVMAWFAGGGWATLFARLIPCGGFECGVGTGLTALLVILIVMVLGGAGIALQMVRRSDEPVGG